MTIKEMHSWFDILQSKGLAIEFTSREKDHILNRAQIKFVNEILQKKYLPSLKQTEREELIYSVTDSVISGHDSIYPLLGRTSNTNIADSSSRIFFSGINSAVAQRLRDLNIKPANYSGARILMILGVIDYDSGLPLRYINSSDLSKRKTNVFREPKNYDAAYTIAENYIGLQPSTYTANKAFVIHYVREPEPVYMSNDSANRVNCELPDWTHDEIMAIALDDAGVATRDQTLMQLNQANKDNLTESA